ncbi:MAG: hypothetical protein HYX53_01190 [Chloroflexi bacterium]|nr:hypothetical protein [Chloroflexota bacterium]
MYFLLLYDYVEDMAAKRAPVRALHLEHANAYYERGVLRMAGAFADSIDGAVLVFRADSAAEVEEFARNDPYVLNGLVTNWRVRPWTVVIGGEGQV